MCFEWSVHFLRSFEENERSTQSNSQVLYHQPALIEMFNLINYYAKMTDNDIGVPTDCRA